MAKKTVIQHYLNMRALKSGFYSAVCRLPGLRDYLNYYQDAICFEDIADEGSVRCLEIDPVAEYGAVFSAAEIRDLLRGGDAAPEALRLVYKAARLTDVAILGSSGVTVDRRTRRAVSLDRHHERLAGNWVVARPLGTVSGDDGATYVNLLWMRRGHRHFAHFFWDMLLPVLVFLKNWRDPEERLVFLVRADRTPIQKDTYRFLEREYPNVSFQMLPANRKMICRRSIFVTSQHRFYGVANTLARDYLRDMADFYLRHYGIGEPPTGPGRRLYLSREGAGIRRVTNEPAVVAMLERYGFESVETGSIPFRRQAELFRSADIVVAPCGAALANLMFCRPGTRVLEFFPGDYADDCFLRMSRVLGLEYRYVFGGRRDFPKRNYAMDPGKLENAVRALFDVRSGVQGTDERPVTPARRGGGSSPRV